MLHSSHFGSVTFSACPPGPSRTGPRYARSGALTHALDRPVDDDGRRAGASEPVITDGTGP